MLNIHEEKRKKGKKRKHKKRCPQEEGKMGADEAMIAGRMSVQENEGKIGIDKSLSCC